jgi:translation initiation factor 2 subunit 1
VILPESNEVVLCTVKEITPHGIYANLDEYNGINGFLHISEISTGWVKNIEKVAKPQQKLVLKVIRADKLRKEIDLSLRQVTNEERRNKIIEWKQKERASTIMNIVKEELSLDDKQFNEYVAKLEEKFNSLYEALETAAKNGEKNFSSLEISSTVLDKIIAIAKEKIIPPKYEIGVIFEIISKASDGVQQIKKALISASDISPTTEIKITYVGAPRYRLRVIADDYKQAEKVMNMVVERIKESIGKHAVFSFRREMSRKYGGAT